MEKNRNGFKVVPVCNKRFFNLYCGFDMHGKFDFTRFCSMIIANNVGRKFERINCHNICLCQTKLLEFKGIIINGILYYLSYMAYIHFVRYLYKRGMESIQDWTNPIELSRSKYINLFNQKVTILWYESV